MAWRVYGYSRGGLEVFISEHNNENLANTAAAGYLDTNGVPLTSSTGDLLLISALNFHGMIVRDEPGLTPAPTFVSDLVDGFNEEGT